LNVAMNSHAVLTISQLRNDANPDPNVRAICQSSKDVAAFGFDADFI
jgi:hypothetical protein